MATNSTRAKVNPPDIFRGTGDNLDTFLTQCRLYFFLNAAEFDTQAKKSIFMVSYMRGTAYATFEARLSEYLAEPRRAAQETQRLFGVEGTLEAELKLVFGSVDKKRALERELHLLRQKTSAKDYAANFQRITAGLGWNDPSLMSQFHAGLKWEVRCAILRKETQPTNINELITTAVKEDDLIYQVQLERKSQGSKKTFNKPNQGQARSYPSDYLGSRPMELDKLQKAPRRERGKSNRGKASPQKGKCYNCGKEGHFANKCRQPKKDKDRQFQYADRPLSSFKKLQPVETAQLAMLTPFKKPNWKWGVNQKPGNESAVYKILQEEPHVAKETLHRLHWILPMSECKVSRCVDWNHRARADPGESWWDFEGIPQTLSNTKIRIIARNDDIRGNVNHVHHNHLPRNCCDDWECQFHHPISEGSPVQQEVLDALRDNPEDQMALGLPLSPKLRREDASLHSRTPTHHYVETEESQDEDIEWRAKQEALSPRSLRWAKKPHLDSQYTGHHRDLPSNQCQEKICAWHQRKPTPMPRILDAINRSFTPETNETDEDEERTIDDVYLGTI
jgi:hypothetical protein